MGRRWQSYGKEQTCDWGLEAEGIVTVEKEGVVGRYNQED